MLSLRHVLAWITVAWLLSPSCVAQDTSQHIDNIIQELRRATSDTVKMKLLLSSANYYIAKPFEEKKDLDSALYFLERCEQLAKTSAARLWKARCDLTRSRLLRERGDRPQGKVFADTAIQFFRVSEYRAEYADAIIEFANYFEPDKDDELAKRISLYNEAISIYESLKPTIYLADYIRRLGEYYLLQENYQEAIRQFKKSLAVYGSLNYKKVHEVYDLLGRCYSESGNHKKAIEYGLKSLDVAFESKDTFTLCTLYNHLGISYFHAKHYQEANNYFGRALVIADQHRDSVSMITLILNSANTFNRVNKLDSAFDLLKYIERNFVLYDNENKRSFYAVIIINYCKRNLPGPAKPYYEKLMELDKSSGIAVNSYIPIIMYNLAVKKFQKAYYYLAQFEVACNNNGVVSLRPYVYLLRFRTDSASGNMAGAIRNYQQYKAVEDSLFDEENTHAINELTIEYETNKKDNELKLNEANIAVLNKQQKLQEAEITSSRTSRNIVIGGSIGLVILLVLIFNQYHAKKKQYALERKSNEKLISKQREINDKNALLQELVDSKELLVKETHHRVKNSLQVIMSLLNTQSDYSSSQQAFVTIQQSRQRLYAISLIHQKLYYNDTLTLVKMDTYIPELIDFLKDGYIRMESIRFDLCVQPIELDITQAVPVGLILNEAVTNSIKHAFPVEGGGIIKVSFTAGKEGLLIFIIEDNGKGLPDEAAAQKINSMGMHLMQTLSEQLGGKITFDNQDGLKVTVTFKQRDTLFLESQFGQVSQLRL